MRDFLDVAELVRDGLEPGNPLRGKFDLVFRAIAELQSVFAKSALDLDNIESVFAAFEMANLFGRLGNLQQAELDNLTSAIKSLIVNTLEARLVFGRDNEGHILPPSPYDKFADIIRQMRSVQNVTVMTFNYDLAMDYALSFNSLDADYFLSADHSSGSIPLLKLHGSLNWTRCNSCKTLQATPVENLMRGLPFVRASHGITIPFSRRLPLCACGMGSAQDPLIVPPTWNKTQHYTGISSVWSTAALHLSEAENIVVIGYSLPETDQFFRYLYALGTVSKVRLKLFWLINPDSGIGQRFEGLLGPLARDRVKVNDIPFHEAIGLIRTEFVKLRKET